MKSKQGGARPNAGRKPKYNEATTTVAFRVPLSKVAQVKAAVSYIISTTLPQNTTKKNKITALYKGKSIETQ